MSNSLDPDQARQNVGPDMHPNCLQRLSADDTGSFKNILRTLVKSMAMKNRSMSVVSDPHLRSNLKNNMVKPRIMCCFGVLENANLSSFIPQITTTKGPKLKYHLQLH